MEPFILTARDKTKIKEIVQMFELARIANKKSDSLISKSIIDSIKIEEAVIAPLKNISEWNESTDGKFIEKLTQKISDDIQEKDLGKFYEKATKVFDKNGGLLGRLLSPIKKKETRSNEQIKLKKIVGYFKIISKLNYAAFNSMIQGANFNLLAIKPLKEMSDWNSDDDLTVNELYQKMHDRTIGKKTLKEQRDAIQTLLKRGGKIAIFIGIAGAIGGLGYYIYRKKTAKKPEE